MAKRKITLGDREFEFTVPLTLGQLMEANVGMALAPSADPQEELRRGWKRAMDVMLVALRPDYPNITAEELQGLRGVTLADFNGAARAALEESGLIQKQTDDRVAEGQPAAGEAQAEAA